MKQTIYFAVAAIGAFTTGVAHAQLAEPSSTSREQQLVEKVGLERLSASATLPTLTNLQNVANLLQIGNGNTARIDQQSLTTTTNQAYIAQIGGGNILGLSQLGGNNRLYVTQNGSDNRAGFTQNGQDNSTTITQNGPQNKIQGVKDGTDMVLEGDHNNMKITQSGGYNTVKGEIQESNRHYEIRQFGNQNKLIQVESTMQTPTGYTVEMRGNGINLTIEQGRITH